MITDADAALIAAACEWRDLTAPTAPTAPHAPFSPFWAWLDALLRAHDAQATEIERRFVEATDKLLAAITAAEERGRQAERATPIPMILHCPACGRQHVDAPESETGWTNPPHRSHTCHGCGVIWRPADVATVGVASISTRGNADTYDGKASARQAGIREGIEMAAQAAHNKGRYSERYLDGDLPDDLVAHNHLCWEIRDAIRALLPPAPKEG
jgi:hypothetical protein